MAKRILISVGDILKEEYLDPMGISAYRLAREIGVSTSLMSQIIRGTTAVSADLAASRTDGYSQLNLVFILNFSAPEHANLLEKCPFGHIFLFP